MYWGVTRDQTLPKKAAQTTSFYFVLNQKCKNNNPINITAGSPKITAKNGSKLPPYSSKRAVWIVSVLGTIILMVVANRLIVMSFFKYFLFACSCNICTSTSNFRLSVKISSSTRPLMPPTILAQRSIFIALWSKNLIDLENWPEREHWMFWPRLPWLTPGSQTMKLCCWPHLLGKM